MKLMYLITGLSVGGAERLVVNYSEYFSNHGHSVYIIYMGGEPVIVPSDSKIQLISLGMDKSIISAVLGFFRLRNHIKSIKPDIVNSHLFHANIFSRLVRLTVYIPILISSIHNKIEGGIFRTMCYRLTDRLSNCSTNVSHEAANEFVLNKAVPQHKMKVIYNSIDTDKFVFDQNIRESVRFDLGISATTKVILAVGSLTLQKDYPNLINAFDLLKNKYTDSIKLLIVGDGTEKERLVNMVNGLGLQNSILFLGIRHDISQLMSCCDVFVLSSAWEGFGLVVAEAMSTERVVVATDSGGVREVIGDCGYLVDPKDSYQLSCKLFTALSLTNLELSYIGKFARERIVKNYSYRNSMDKWLHLFSSYINKIKYVD